MIQLRRPASRMCCFANLPTEIASIPAGDPATLLAELVNRVSRRGGSIIIPAFAVGRTQTFMYYLRELEAQNRIPRLPVYVDSPMALSATDLYLKYRDDHDVEFAKIDAGGQGDPLSVREFHLTRSVQESKAINNVKTPCIIVSASGMVAGGRRAAPFGAAAAGLAQPGAPRRISGARHAGTGAARRREDFEIVRSGCARECGNRADESTLRACREK